MYLFQGIERLSFGWYTPNEVALFLAELLFVIIAVAIELVARGKTRAWLPVVMGALTGPLTYALGRTGSRGVIVAVAAGLASIGGCVVWGYYRGRTKRPLKGLLQFATTTVALFALALVYTKAFERLSPVSSAGDPAVINRLAIWRAFPSMLEGAPWFGWGAGHGPGVYSNWFQDPNVGYAYTSLVSTYLDIGMDHGLAGLWLLVMGASWLICHPLSALRKACFLPSGEAAWRAASVLGMVTCWLVANLTTSYVHRPWLSFFPLALYAVFAWTEISSGGWGVVCRTAKVSGVIATLVLLGLWGGVVYAAKSGDIVCTKTGETRVVLNHRGHVGPVRHWRIIHDPHAMGISPGKMLRTWFAATAADCSIETEMYPFVSDDLLGCTRPPNRTLAVGTACATAAGEDWPCELELLLPASCPPKPAHRIAKCTVYLPEIDERGLNESWIKWAAGSGARVETVAGSGLIAQAHLNPLRQ